jgi:hypothetical protein
MVSTPANLDSIPFYIQFQFGHACSFNSGSGFDRIAVLTWFCLRLGSVLTQLRFRQVSRQNTHQWLKYNLCGTSDVQKIQLVSC